MRSHTCVQVSKICTDFLPQIYWISNSFICSSFTSRETRLKLTTCFYSFTGILLEYNYIHFQDCFNSLVVIMVKVCRGAINGVNTMAGGRVSLVNACKFAMIISSSNVCLNWPRSWPECWNVLLTWHTNKQDSISSRRLFGCRTEAKSVGQFFSIFIFLLQPTAMLIIKTLSLGFKPIFACSVCHAGNGSHSLDSCEGSMSCLLAGGREPG